MRLVATLGKVLVVSPHLDDAVFGCGEFLAACPGCIVVTVFAGAPARYRKLTEWDAAAGFSAGQDVMTARRQEDRRALAIVGALPLWLDFRDSQYQRPPRAQTLAAALESALARHNPDTVVIPFGLFHYDHKLVHEAALITLKRCRRWAWFAYEDALYRRVPGLLQERLAALLSAGITATPVAFELRGLKGRKRRAVRCYASQLHALTTQGRPGYLDAFSPEVYWRLAIRARCDAR
jgi:LmbE family N-acetylglucosaminyl deacetylase